MSDPINQVWRFFHATTGIVLPGAMLLPNQSAVEANTPVGHLATMVEVDHLTQRINIATGLPVAYSPPVVAPAWDAPTARAERDRLLNDSDWIVSRAFETGTAVPTDWATYRAALRNLPNQTGFPASIIWPSLPV